jgi:hypothetical protein
MWGGMFQLRKWYLDCTTPEGGAAIGYWAKAGWGALQLRYAGLLTIPAVAGDAATTSTFRAGNEPTMVDGVIHWSCRALGVQGHWTACCPSVERTLLETEAGSLKWSCVMPRGSCDLDAGGTLVQGLGYAEVLEMTIAPWRLPIRELRWGRWLSSIGSLTWIDWRGPRTLTLIHDEGREVGGVVLDDGVSLSDGRRLSFEAPRVIRDGALGATVLKSLPVGREALPTALLRTHEQKWLARGVLSPSGVDGWVIHERIVFGE